MAHQLGAVLPKTAKMWKPLFVAALVLASVLVNQILKPCAIWQINKN